MDVMQDRPCSDLLPRQDDDARNMPPALPKGLCRFPTPTWQQMFSPPLTPATDVGALFFADLIEPLCAYSTNGSNSPLSQGTLTQSPSGLSMDAPMEVSSKRRKLSALDLSDDSLAIGELLGAVWKSTYDAMPTKKMHLTPLSPPQGVTVELTNQDLWLRFGEHTTEMVLTRKGRCLFPPPKFTLVNLEPHVFYSVVLEIAPLDQNRYKFAAEQKDWVSLGPIDEPGKAQMYTHPSSPQLGSEWTKNDVVSFEHMKVTNNPASPACLLRSAQKYRLRVFVVRHHPLTMEPQQVDEEEFPETEFVAVTVYQNDAIRELKKQFNPRAFK